MKRAIRWFVFDTRAGDLVLQLFERLTGFGLVRLEEFDRERVGATEMGLHSARVHQT